MATMSPEAETALVTFGFTALEALVYCELLRHSPATGYRLSQLLGRAPANIYQILRSLVHKNAVLLDNERADVATYIPVPPEQLFRSLQTGFATRAAAAVDALTAVHRPPAQQTLMQLRNASQVIERARAMLMAAQETVIFDMVPALYDMMCGDLDEARGRGVKMAGIAYRKEDARPDMPFRGEPADAVTKRWPGLGFILVTDASELAVALISPDLTHVQNAIYSDSNFISCILHGLLVNDIRLITLTADADVQLPANEVIDPLQLRSANPPGLRTLLS